MCVLNGIFHGEEKEKNEKPLAVHIRICYIVSIGSGLAAGYGGRYDPFSFRRFATGIVLMRYRQISHISSRYPNGKNRQHNRVWDKRILRMKTAFQEKDGRTDLTGIPAFPRGKRGKIGKKHTGDHCKNSCRAI